MHLTSIPVHLVEKRICFQRIYLGCTQKTSETEAPLPTAGYLLSISNPFDPADLRQTQCTHVSSVRRFSDCHQSHWNRLIHWSVHVGNRNRHRRSCPISPRNTKDGMWKAWNDVVLEIQLGSPVSRAHFGRDILNPTRKDISLLARCSTTKTPCGHIGTSPIFSPDAAPKLPLHLVFRSHFWDSPWFPCCSTRSSTTSIEHGHKSGSDKSLADSSMDQKHFMAWHQKIWTKASGSSGIELGGYCEWNSSLLNQSIAHISHIHMCIYIYVYIYIHITYHNISYHAKLLQIMRVSYLGECLGGHVVHHPGPVVDLHKSGLSQGSDTSPQRRFEDQLQISSHLRKKKTTVDGNIGYVLQIYTYIYIQIRTHQLINSSGIFTNPLSQ